jgi:hypothetical protein
VVALRREEVEHLFHGGMLARVDDEGLKVSRANQDLGDPTWVQIFSERVCALPDFNIPKLFRSRKGSLRTSRSGSLFLRFSRLR